MKDNSQNKNEKKNREVDAMSMETPCFCQHPSPSPSLCRTAMKKRINITAPGTKKIAINPSPEKTQSNIRKLPTNAKKTAKPRVFKNAKRKTPLLHKHRL